MTIFKTYFKIKMVIKFGYDMKDTKLVLNGFVNTFYIESVLLKFLFYNPQISNSKFTKISIFDYDGALSITNILYKYKINFVVNSFHYNGNIFKNINNYEDVEKYYFNYENSNDNINLFIKDHTISKEKFLSIINEYKWVDVNHKINIPSNINHSTFAAVEKYKRFETKHLDYIYFLIDNNIKVSCNNWILDGDTALKIHSPKYLINDEESLKIVNMYSLI